MKLKEEVQQNKWCVRLPALLPVMWIFLSLNYILCDVLTYMETPVINGLLAGNIAGMRVTESFLLIAGISLEIPILMVLMSTILPYKANKIVNICCAVIMIVYQTGSFFVGSGNSLHYLFFSVIEILGNAIIIVLALKWKGDVRVS